MSDEIDDHRSEKRTFTDADIYVFACCVSFCGLVGIFRGCMEMRVRRSEGVGSEKIATGGRTTWTMWQAAQSFLHGSVALPFMLGIPGEIYCFGIIFMILIIGYVIGGPIFIHVVLTRLHKLKISNMYGYFSLRFNKLVHRLVSGIFTVMSLLFIGTIVYGQGLIFSQLTGLNVGTSILIVRCVGFAFTGVGGVKGALWLDVFHLLVIILGIVLLTLLGISNVGSVGKVLSISTDGLRMGHNVWGLQPSLARHSLWSQLIGGSFLIMIIFSNQLITAKYLGHESKTKMIITSYVSVVFSVIKIALCGFLGIVCYAYYYGCDPISLEKVQAPDQLLPALMLDTMSGLPGLPGFIFASILTASLGTISASLNTLSAICLMDFIEPLYTWKTGKTILSPCLGVVFFKILVLSGNLVTLAVPYLCPLMKSTLVQMAIINLTIAGGPILGLFILGIFVPFANPTGAIVGMIVSILWNVWLMVGGIVTSSYSNKAQLLQLDNSMCLPNGTISNTTSFTTTEDPNWGINAIADEGSSIQGLYDLSYMWIGSSSVGYTIVVGIFVSLATGWRSLKTLTVDTDLSFAYGFSVMDKIKDTKDSTEKLDEQDNQTVIHIDPTPYGLSDPKKSPIRRHSTPNISQDVLIHSQMIEDSRMFHHNLMLLGGTGLVWINTEDLVTKL